MSLYAIFDDQRFNDMLTNHIVSFEQMGPDKLPKIMWQNGKQCSPGPLEVVWPMSTLSTLAWLSNS